MSELHQDNTILSHLNEYLQGLERQLNYPKNDWKRQENLMQQLSEAKQRLQSIEKRSTRPHGRQSRSSGRMGSDGQRPTGGHREFSTTSDRTRNPNVIRTRGDREIGSRLAVEYR